MTASAKGDAANPDTKVRQKAGINREILDPSPGMMIAMLRYKDRESCWLVCGRLCKEHLVRMLEMQQPSSQHLSVRIR